LTQSRILVDIKSLASKSAIYGVGSIALKAIGFFLLPLYTRHLTPADYGVMAVAGTLTSALGILYPLSLHGAVMRFYFLAQSEDERRRNNGTIWGAMILIALVVTILLDRFGDTIFPLLFQDIPFVPYIRLAIWIPFFSTLRLLPLVFFQVQERPVPYVLTTVSNTLLTIGLVINFVVLQGQGAYGYLRGVFLAQVLFAVPYVVLTLRNVRMTLQWDVLKAAFGFSLPLVPHGLASWVLELSDRAILQRFVPLGELGLYSLGYQFGTIVSLFATAVNFAWVPFLYKTDAQRGETAKSDLARLATYYTLFLCLIALGLALFVKEIIFLMTSPAFHPAYRVALWIIGGWLLSGLYYIPVNFLFLREKTRFVPLVTVSSGVVNVVLNLWLAPRYGIMAAAWATFLAYGLMLVLVWRLALRVYPFPYEYRRLGLIALVGIGLFALDARLQFNSTAIDLGVKAVLLFAYPFVLAGLGFFADSEKEAVLTLARQTLEGLYRTTHRIQFLRKYE
jgi:O-antigen/teichoic acid export membrane protein